MDYSAQLRYWPYNKPIPAGWELACQIPYAPHGCYAVLIKEIPRGADEGDGREKESFDSGFTASNFET